MNNRFVLPRSLGQIKQLIFWTDGGTLATKSALIVLKGDFGKSAISLVDNLCFAGCDTGRASGTDVSKLNAFMHPRRSYGRGFTAAKEITAAVIDAFCHRSYGV